jgi:membrane-associated phospholipid phosphatase
MARPTTSKTAARAKSARARLKSRLSHEKGLAHADLAVAAAAAKAGRRPAVKPFALLAEIADKRPLLAGGIAIAGIGALRGDRRMRRSGLRMLLAVGLALGATRLGKSRIGRTRPDRLVDEGQHAFHPGGPDAHDWNSFPSAHSAGGFAAARALGRDYKWASPPGLSAAVTAGGLKVLKGDHFPSDVIAGLAIGWCAEAIAAAVIPPDAEAGR